MPFRSGFVCILGRPNAGKSTMLNALVGEKLAIISPKPQTTRNRIQGVVHLPKSKGRDAGQIVLLDTPGVHKPDSSLGRKMMVEVREALEGCDLVLVIMDVTRKFDPRDQFALDLLKQSFEEGKRLTRISATIYCERDGQKGILVGKRGQMLKRIGTGARLQIERMLGTKVFLELYVKVQPGWRDSRSFVQELDWRRQLEQLSASRLTNRHETEP
jgi:small GTP-binding protein